LTASSGTCYSFYSVVLLLGIDFNIRYCSTPMVGDTENGIVSDVSCKIHDKVCLNDLSSIFLEIMLVLKICIHLNWGQKFKDMYLRHLDNVFNQCTSFEILKRSKFLFLLFKTHKCRIFPLRHFNLFAVYNSL